MSKLRILFLVGFVLASGIAWGPAQSADMKPLAEQALSTDTAAAEKAIGELRAAGPEGLKAMLAVHAAAIERHRNSPVETDEAWKRLSAALNAVGGQYDCHASKLFWHTDLDAAKSAAKASGKPILSLRMLGKLTEECSCANSRFFRTTLYANEEVGKVLRDQYILHWKSVRPVPKVSIDFGDGRKMERTLTGNSIHYILDAEGRPLEAIPGLYGPKAFLRHLEGGRALFSLASSVPPAQRDALLRTVHSRRGAEVVAAWKADLEKAGVNVPSETATYNTSTSASSGGAADRAPTAREAARLAVSKGLFEVRLIDDMARIALSRETSARSANTLEKAMSEEAWKAIAALHREEAALDAGSISLIREHNPSAITAAAVTETKRRVENPLLRMIANFQESISLDTVRNEYLYHRRIHDWFAGGEGVTRDVEELNKRIYAELFLTPDSDPWLGLMEPDVYSGLRNHGVTR
jgi:hypothetical protein